MRRGDGVASRLKGSPEGDGSGGLSLERGRGSACWGEQKWLPRQAGHRLRRACRGWGPPVGGQAAGVGRCLSGALRGLCKGSDHRGAGFAVGPESCPHPQLQEGFFLSPASPVTSRGTAEGCAGVLPGTCTPSIRLGLTGGAWIRGPDGESVVGGGLGLLWSKERGSAVPMVAAGTLGSSHTLWPGPCPLGDQDGGWECLGGSAGGASAHTFLMETDIWATCIEQSPCFRPQGGVGQSPQRHGTREWYLRRAALMSLSSSALTLSLGPQPLERGLLGARSGRAASWKHAGGARGSPRTRHQAPDTREAAGSRQPALTRPRSGSVSQATYSVAGRAANRAAPQAPGPEPPLLPSDHRQGWGWGPARAPRTERTWLLAAATKSL